jgi:hypothetical protein
VVITGNGFGSEAPFDGNRPCIEIRDVDREWSAGHIDPQSGDSGGSCSAETGPYGDRVTINVTSWDPSKVEIAGFRGDYGAGDWSLRAGDNVRIAIWNAQTGSGPDLYRVTVASGESSSGSMGQ